MQDTIRPVDDQMAWKETLQVSATPSKSNEAHWHGSRGIRMLVGSLPPVDIQINSSASPALGKEVAA